MGDEDLAHTGGAGGRHQQHDLGRRKVAGAQDGVVLGDEPQNFLDDGFEAVAFQHGEAGRAMGARVAHGREGGHPDFHRAQPQGGLHRRGVEPAHGIVERQAAKNVDAGHQALHQLGPAGGEGGMRLEQDGAHTALGGLAGGFHIVHLARRDVGRGMDVHVDGASEIDAGGGSFKLAHRATTRFSAADW